MVGVTLGLVFGGCSQLGLGDQAMLGINPKPFMQAYQPIEPSPQPLFGWGWGAAGNARTGATPSLVFKTAQGGVLEHHAVQD